MGEQQLPGGNIGGNVQVSEKEMDDTYQYYHTEPDFPVLISLVESYVFDGGINVRRSKSKGKGVPLDEKKLRLGRRSMNWRRQFGFCPLEFTRTKTGWDIHVPEYSTGVFQRQWISPTRSRLIFLPRYKVGTEKSDKSEIIKSEGETYGINRLSISNATPNSQKPKRKMDSADDQTHYEVFQWEGVEPTANTLKLTTSVSRLRFDFFETIEARINAADADWYEIN